jgi:hypothetical protein
LPLDFESHLQGNVVPRAHARQRGEFDRTARAALVAHGAQYFSGQVFTWKDGVCYKGPMVRGKISGA